MKAQHLPLRDTGFVSGLICDYLEGAQGLKGFHNGPPSFENLNRQAVQKRRHTLLILGHHYALY